MRNAGGLHSPEAGILVDSPRPIDLPDPSIARPLDRESAAIDGVAVAESASMPPSQELKPLQMLDDAAAAAASSVHRFVRRHPRGLAAAVVVSLTGFGATAFGIAPIAPLLLTLMRSRREQEAIDGREDLGFVG